MSHRTRLLVVVAVTVLLVLAWFLGDQPEAETPPSSTLAASTEPVTTVPPGTEAPTTATTEPTSEPTTTPSTMAATEPTTEPPTMPPTEPTTASPTEPPATTAPSSEDGAMTCRLVIRCDTLLDRLDELAEEKHSLVPENGVLLDVIAEFFEGESVMSILTRETRRARLHMEFVDTPGLGTAYVKGIGNLYERDCGPLSGWAYKVNEVFPGFGCSSYLPKDGDVIVFAYTCDMGADVGNVAIEE